MTQNRDHSPLTPGPQNGLNEIVDLKDASNTVTDNLSYDDAGNLTAITPVSGTARNFTWDANSRLKMWTKGATTIGYQYDAYGRRVSDGTRRYIYGLGWRVAEERDLTNSQTDITDGGLIAMPLLKTLVYGNYIDEVVQYDTKVNPIYDTAPTARWDGRDDSGYDTSWTDGKTGEEVYSRSFHIHSDQIFSAKVLSTSVGDICEYYDYSAYGSPVIYKDAGADGHWFTPDDTVSIDDNGIPISGYDNRRLFTGQYWDSANAVYYFKTRYFDSTLGRFLDRNPWGFIQSRLNLYDYVGMNPCIGVEPFSWAEDVADFFQPYIDKAKEPFEAVKSLAGPNYLGLNPIHGVVNVMEMPYEFVDTANDALRLGVGTRKAVAAVHAGKPILSSAVAGNILHDVGRAGTITVIAGAASSTVKAAVSAAAAGATATDEAVTTANKVTDELVDSLTADGSPVVPEPPVPEPPPTNTPKAPETPGTDPVQPNGTKPCDLGPHAPGDVPDSNVVVKGGTRPPPSETFSGAQGRTLGEAGQGVPHNQVQATTAGDIRASGGTVDVAPEPAGPGSPVINYQHVNVTPGEGPNPFGPPEPNPAPKGARIRP